MKNLLFFISLIFFFFCFSFFCFSQNTEIRSEQNRTIDSLLSLLKTDKSDTNKLNHLYKLSDEYVIIGNYPGALNYCKEALNLADIILDKLNNERLKIYINTNKILIYNMIGIVYNAQGNYPEALKNFLISLKISEKIGNRKSIASSYNNIGEIYRSQVNYSEALKNYFASLKISKAIGDKDGMSSSYNNIGLVYYNQGNFPEAIKNLFASLKIAEEIGDKASIAYSYINIGSFYGIQGNYPEALKNYFIGLKIEENIGDKAGIVATCNNIGVIFTKQKKFKEAEEYLIKAKELSEEIGHKGLILDSYHYLSNMDSAKGNYKSAYENYKMYILYCDSLDNEETRKKTIQTQMTYEFEKKEAIAVAEHKKEMENQKTLADEKSRKQKMVIGFVVIGLLLVLVFAGLIFRSLRITRRQKQMIETQKDEIEAQRDMVTQQKEQIEEIHQEVTDSIQYAKRIQTAVLPNYGSLKDRIQGDFFILFKPKDIVSGDFYFAEKRKNMLFVAVSDCTGHGVPGAFMSMLGISFLNEIIAKPEIQSACNVLEDLRKHVINSLQQKGISGEQKDGMDIAFCAINMDTLEMQFAGANNPCYIIANTQPVIAMAQPEAISTAQSDCFVPRNDEYNFVDPVIELVEIKGDKMPIGIHTNMQPFTNQIYQLQKGDIIYLMSDGYEDQFGGSRRKKFLSKNLKNLLMANSQKPMAEQKQILETTIVDWIGAGEQIDDISITGVKI